MKRSMAFIDGEITALIIAGLRAEGHMPLSDQDPEITYHEERGDAGDPREAGFVRRTVTATWSFPK